MNKQFSAYIDIVRFLAAFTVFLGHASTKYMTGGLFWRLAPYGDTCVVIFFVLSGFVIAYVADTKDTSWQLYASNRAARLWSVVLPALVLTYCIDLVGVRVAPEIYDGPWFTPDNPALRYLASALMMQELWHAWLVPGVNNPFWSLTYEAIYYAAFGVLMFLKSRARWPIAIAVLVFGGPLIAVLAPTWALGYVAYRITRRQSFSRLASIVLFFGGAAMLAVSPVMRSSIIFDIPVMGQPVLGRYVDALAIFAHLIGAYGLASSASWFSGGTRAAISKVASITFVLYLFHRPLIQMFSFAEHSDPSSLPRRLILITGTLVICFAAVPATERLRIFIRHWLLRAFSAKKGVAVPA